ncbi:hypothetical protein ACJZ2D_014664 [Fusarium nematophilum]
MTSLLKFTKTVLRQKPLPSLRFPSNGFEVVAATEVLEEERFSHFKQGIYCPVNIGDVFATKYQVVGKLGFGVTSTVWLARDLQEHRFVTLKIFTRESSNDAEYATHQHMIDRAKPSHEGFPFVRTALEALTVKHSGSEHFCLVQKPMWDSFRDLLYRNPMHRFTADLLRVGLSQVFLALDYLHTECKLVHTDIKADNILQEIEDHSILDAFVQDEMAHPSARKFIDGQTIYTSRQFLKPRVFGRAVLSDFGSAVRGDVKNNDDVQPNVYRSPEVMLKTEWSYPIDIWNVGVMVWDLFGGKHMFYGNDPDGKGYSTRAHLAEVIAMLGPPPLDLLQRGKRSKEFFTPEGNWKAEVEIQKDLSLESSEQFLEGTDKKQFLDFMRGMLQWRPEDRKTARQLLEDPWLNSE